ncbi:MAG: indolepyruvate oxidoreductase subunit beta [Clostridia bacterium]|nr:indolepyruvate oxidoreductase subunit beta [Clostridia bacterium]MDD4799094.1 indolepyruvate oxidoreductase subunit beta [Clostridia bacterium]
MTGVNNILIVGVGGQGTILASRILAEVAIAGGYQVKISEIHGMSQRGGSVMTQLRFADEVFSPVIEPSTADILLSFEMLEALRALPYLKEGGELIVSKQELLPMPVITGTAQYPADIAERLLSVVPDAQIVDALSLAKKAGTVKAVNVVLLGMLSRHLPFDENSWLQAIRKCVKPKTVEINLKAFALGRG